MFPSFFIKGVNRLKLEDKIKNSVKKSDFESAINVEEGVKYAKMINKIIAAYKGSHWDKNIFHGITLRAVFEFFVITFVLCIVGFLAHYKLSESIDEAHDSSVSHHIDRVAYIIENQFDNRLHDLQVNMKLIEKGELTAQELIELSRKVKWSSTTGIVAPNGRVVAGDELSSHVVADLDDVFFRRKNLVIYHNEGGLLFAIPVHIDGQMCAYWEQYENDRIPAMFGISSYDDAGRVVLGCRKNNNWTILTASTSNDEIYDKLYYDIPDFKKFFITEIVDKMVIKNKSIGHYEYENEDYLVFASKLYHETFAIFGIVRRDAFAVGINYVHNVIIGIFCLLIVILIMYARHTIKTAENRELQQERQAAINASKTKSEFLSNMSHEIRTPINAILGMDEMILRESKEPTTLEYAENLRHAGVSLLGIVNDILDFSKIEAGKMEIIPVEYQLSSLLNDLVKGLSFI